MNLSQKIKHKGLELGFTHVGITSADDFPAYEQELRSREDYITWYDPDRSKYPGRSDLARSARPKEFYPQAKSIICATIGFSQYDYPEILLASVARAYLGRSYVPQPSSAAGIRVAEFKRYIKEDLGIGLYEGTAELPERAACARAGIITYGRNNFAYTEEDGSFNILFTFIVDAELEIDEPTVRCDCPPNCTICMDVCPTKAIASPGRLLPHRCLLFNETIPVSDDTLWDAHGTSIHGCDICQVNCPRNQKVLKKATRREPLLEELAKDFDLEKVLHLDAEYYEAVIQPIMYNYITDMNIFRRNAAIALGNSGNPDHIPALETALAYDNTEVQRAVKWALEKLKR